MKRERERERQSTGIQTQGLLTTSRTLLELSHWTHGRGAEASLLITVILEASADSSCLSLSQSDTLHKLCFDMTHRIFSPDVQVVFSQVRDLGRERLQ